ncbi:hypothetical protein [Paraglaciecola sp. L3A3]|uniref:hypothetical protein n=1 Tax=Paraglaciecola sp. L3A3 TaxID=2686358 RepID=UPI00131AA191|nr:hypothetical protein [Paraglaciecola sp. L3A3]
MKQQALVLGVTRSKGTSKKTGNDYDISKINIASEGKAFGSEGEAFGLAGQELNITPELFQKAKGLKYPLTASISFNVDLGSGRLSVIDVEAA